MRGPFSNSKSLSSLVPFSIVSLFLFLPSSTTSRTLNTNTYRNATTGARIFPAICRHNLRRFHGRYAVFSYRVRRFFMGGTLILPRGYGNVPEGYAAPSWTVRPYFMGGTLSRASLPRPPSWEVRR